MLTSPPPFDFTGWPFNSAIDDPPTMMVPPLRPGVFAVIVVDGREALLRVCRRTTQGDLLQLRQERDQLRFVGDTVDDGRRVAVELADILFRYQRIAELHGAAVRAVAAPAFRHLPNATQLLQRLPAVTRVPLELIADHEAATLVCRGALAGRPAERQVLVVEVGRHESLAILARGTEPLAMWRLAIGTAPFLGLSSEVSAGRPSSESGEADGGPDGVRMRAWARRVRKVLGKGQMDAIRGVATEVLLVRRRGTSPTDREHQVAVTALNEIALRLEIPRLQSTERGLAEGLLLEAGANQGRLEPTIAAPTPTPTPLPDRRS